MLEPKDEEHIIKYASEICDKSKRFLPDPGVAEEVEEHRGSLSKLLAANRIMAMPESSFREIIKNLWATKMWKNKDVPVDKMLRDNDFKEIKKSLHELLYGSDPLQKRFDEFKKIKHVGPATITELLCLSNPDKYPLWNNRAAQSVLWLVENHEDYGSISKAVNYPNMITGDNYVKCNEFLQSVRGLLLKNGFVCADLLELDGIIQMISDKIWEVEGDEEYDDEDYEEPTPPIDHWGAIGMITEIGNMLGFDTYVADPAKTYNGKPLRELATSESVPEQCRAIPGVERIDAIWFRQTPPFYMFEVEDRGTMRDALLRLYQTIHFNSKLLVVCPAENKSKFDKYIKTAPFNAVRDEYQFSSFDELFRLYRATVDFDHAKKPFCL